MALTIGEFVVYLCIPFFLTVSLVRETREQNLHSHYTEMLHS